MDGFSSGTTTTTTITATTAPAAAAAAATTTVAAGAAEPAAPPTAKPATEADEGDLGLVDESSSGTISPITPAAEPPPNPPAPLSSDSGTADAVASKAAATDNADEGDPVTTPAGTATDNADESGPDTTSTGTSDPVACSTCGGEKALCKACWLYFCKDCLINAGETPDGRCRDCVLLNSWPDEDESQRPETKAFLDTPGYEHQTAKQLAKQMVKTEKGAKPSVRKQLQLGDRNIRPPKQRRIEKKPEVESEKQQIKEPHVEGPPATNINKAPVYVQPPNTQATALSGSDTSQELAALRQQRLSDRQELDLLRQQLAQSGSAQKPNTETTAICPLCPRS